MAKKKAKSSAENIQSDKVDSQAGDGYGCACGFKTLKKGEFTGHLLKQGRLEPGKHVSIGRVNMVTGDVTLPPWTQRSKEEKEMSSVGSQKIVPSSQQGTGVIADATQLRFVPRFFTVNFTPILQQAPVIARKEWNWPEMSLEDFLDTIVYHFFKDRGIRLGAYIIEEQEVEHGS